MRSKPELTEAIRRDSRAVLVVNTQSRRAAAAHRELPAMLEDVGVRLLADLPVAEPERLKDAVSEAMSHDPDLVVFGGGDGSMASAVNLLAHRDAALGVLPLGTTNNFARSLGLPLDLRGAVEIIGQGVVADVDLGRLRDGDDEMLFANLASIGLSVEISRHVPHRLKKVLGRAAYGLTAAYTMARHRAFRATVTTSDGAEMFWTHQLNVANGGFHAGHKIAHDASIDDRRLVVYRLGDRSRPGTPVAMVVHMVRGRRRRLAVSEFVTACEVRLETVPAREIDVDGEIWGRTPVTITSVPNALRVMVDTSFEDT